MYGLGLGDLGVLGPRHGFVHAKDNREFETTTIHSSI
jgi:hypothetical protein